MPYTYILYWSVYNRFYIGARWARNCNPSDLWVTYFTSSKYVKDFVKDNGQPDFIIIDKIFSDPKDAGKREDFLLRKYNVINNPIFLNKAISGVYNYLD